MEGNATTSWLHPTFEEDFIVNPQAWTDPATSTTATGVTTAEEHVESSSSSSASFASAFEIANEDDKMQDTPSLGTGRDDAVLWLEVTI